MLMTAKTFNGNTLNSSDYKAAVLSISPPTATPSFIAQAQADAQYSGAYSVEARNVALGIEIIDYADRYAMRDQLNLWFKRGTQGDLVATFKDENADYQLPCVVVSLTQDKTYPTFFTAILQTGETMWRSVAPETDTWTPTGTSGSKTITVGGQAETRLSLVATPSATITSGFASQRLYQLVNVPGVDYGLRPWCIELDTETIIDASGMQADCDDLRIYNGDTEIKRWIDSPDTTTSKVWFNIDIKPGFDLTLLTAVANTNPITLLQFDVNTTMSARIAAMPETGIVYRSTEWFHYSSRDSVTCRLTIDQRGYMGTTKTTHDAATTFKYVAAPIKLVYGNSTIGNPAGDDDHYDDDKPVFDLHDSTNTTWVYSATSQFYDAAYPNRPGAWRPQMIVSGGSQNTTSYRYKGNAGTGDPAMGYQVGACYSNGQYISNWVYGGWFFNSPGGIEKISMTGRKYRATYSFWTGLWTTAAGLKKSVDNSTISSYWEDVFAEAMPTNPDTYYDITQTDKTMDATIKYLCFGCWGEFPAGKGIYMQLEALTASIDFVDATLPTGTLLSAGDNVTLDITIENTENHDEVRVVQSMPKSTDFSIDGETNIVTCGSMNAYNSITLNDLSRPEIIRLVPGNNDLTIASPDLGTLNIALSWYKRRP